MKKLPLSPVEIIRGFAAVPPRPNEAGECPHCQMPCERNRHFDEDRGLYVNTLDQQALRSPHLHFPDCTWRQAVEWTERNERSLNPL